jgi:hypothetical protein
MSMSTVCRWMVGVGVAVAVASRVAASGRLEDMFNTYK